MIESQLVFKCLTCGATVEVVGAAGGTLVCCGKPMRLMRENETDGSTEKHVPVLEENGSGVKVKVGSLPHPMEPDHYIEWIEIINGPYVNRRYLTPGEAPEAEFYVPRQAGLVVRAFCNKHGLWKN